MGEGVRGGRGGAPATILVLPSHRQPKSIGGGETSPPDLGAHLWVHTQGASGEGTKRWGIEGIRRGTSDRFGRGRGELLLFLEVCCLDKRFLKIWVGRVATLGA